MKTSLIFAFLAFLSSCATLNKEECQTANWKDIGYKDGSLGKPTTHFAKHAKACSEHGVQPDRAVYDGGYQQGLRVFCIPENGYQVGKSGGAYDVTCPADLAAAFSKAFHHGKDWRELHSQFENLDKRVNDLEDQADREADMEKRRELRRQARSLSRDRDTARTRLLILESHSRHE